MDYIHNNANQQICVKSDNIRLAVFAIVFGVLAASLSDAFIKLVSANFQLWQIFVLRSGMIIPVLAVIVKLRSPSVSLIPTNIGWTTVRSLMLVFMWLTYYAALPMVAFSVAASVYYTLPLFITLFAAVFMGEKVTPKGWVAVVLGFIGVLVILRPQATDFNLYALLPLASAILYALAMIVTRSHCRHENTLVLTLSLNVGFFCVGIMASVVIALWEPTSKQIASNVFLFGSWVPVGTQEWIIILVLAILLTTSTAFATLAYQSGPSSIVSSFDFFYLAFVVTWGIIFFSEIPDAITVMGIILITIAGIIAVKR